MDTPPVTTFQQRGQRTRPCLTDIGDPRGVGPAAHAHICAIVEFFTKGWQVKFFPEKSVVFTRKSAVTLP